MEARNVSRKTVIVVAVIVSLFMYFAGVFSGLYANKVVENKVSEDIGFLKNYVDSSSLDLKNVLLQQAFMDNMEDPCKFRELYIQNLRKQLDEYWGKLPARLEAYENTGQINSEYSTLKREYIRLSLRIWLAAENNNRKCGRYDPSFLLYFYSKDCKDCVTQGELFDQFKRELGSLNRTLFVFPIDANFEDDSVYLMKQYYNLTSFPAVVANERVIQGHVVGLPELRQLIK